MMGVVDQLKPRTIAPATAARAATAVPTVAPIIRGIGEQTERYDTSITPPGNAFAVWRRS